MTVRWDRDKPMVTDGPYAETKEVLGGILLLEADDLNHAVQLISRHPGVRKGAPVTVWGWGEDASSARTEADGKLKRLLERLTRGEPFPHREFAHLQDGDAGRAGSGRRTCRFWWRSCGQS